MLAEAVNKEFCSSRGGNEQWLAPEVIYPEAFGLTSNRPMYASDIYSFGCLWIEVSEYSLPFFSIPTDDMMAPSYSQEIALSMVSRRQNFS